MSPLRATGLLLLGLAIAWLGIKAPAATVRELAFLAGILLLTSVTRSMAAGSALSALGAGLGLSVPLVVGAGHLVTAIGIDTSDGLGNRLWLPILEESIKLLPVALVALLHWRRSGLSLNPSDLLAAGCCAGGGFALVENAMLVENGGGVLRDMARQYGPHIAGFYLVPAWGAAGYVGHAAATGLICGGLGLGMALRRIPWWAAIPAACFAWVTGEHVLANTYVGTGSEAWLLLGNGRLTPWLFVALAVAIVVLDLGRARQALLHSRRLRQRLAMARAALLRFTPPLPASRLAALALFASHLRAVNATAWWVRGDARLRSRT
jgi:RsiW-degrading membrane proteinase PrsW (M82 family)